MSRDIPAIDAIIAGFCSSHDEPNAAEQAIAFDQSLERSGWSIVRTEELITASLRKTAMDDLGRRLIDDRHRILEMRQRADALEREVARLRKEADQIERISELVRLDR